MLFPAQPALLPFISANLLIFPRWYAGRTNSGLSLSRRNSGLSLTESIMDFLRGGVTETPRSSGKYCCRAPCPHTHCSLSSPRSKSSFSLSLRPSDSLSMLFLSLLHVTSEPATLSACDSPFGAPNKTPADFEKLDVFLSSTS